jgi:hypothetical protein
MESIEFLENYQTIFVTCARLVVRLAFGLSEKGKPGPWGQVPRFVFVGTRGQVRYPAYFAAVRIILHCKLESF